MLRSPISQTIQQVNRNFSKIKCKRLEGKVAIVTASTEGFDKIYCHFGIPIFLHKLYILIYKI